MKKHEYQLIHIPKILYTLRLLIVIIATLILPFLLLAIISIEVNPILILFCSFGLAFFLLKISAKIVRNKLHIAIEKGVLRITETSSLTNKKKEKIINWSDLKSYVFYTTQYYHILKLYTAKGKKITLTLDHDSRQLARFEEDFRNKVSSINQIGHTSIFLKPSIYETNAGFGIAIVLILLMIGWPLVAWINHKSFQIGLALVFYSGASFFIYMVYQHYKRNKTLD